MSINSTYVATLTVISGTIPFFINFLTIIIGTIGGICNLITFTAPKLRYNSCVFYLLCVSIFQILSIGFNIPTRIASDNFGSNLEVQSIIFCKLRYYLALALPELVTYYMLLAIIDRYLSTSNHAEIRAWSQLKVAHRLSIGLLIIVSVTGIYSIVFYDIYNNTCQVPPDKSYTIFFAVYLIVIVTLLPHILMFIFSFMTFSNLKKIRQRVSPIISNTSNSRTKRFESQLIKIMVVQVLLSSILVSLRLGSYTYITMTSGNLNKSINERIIEAFILKLGIALYYFSFAISFYVLTLTSKFFRNIFSKRIHGFYRHYRRLKLIIFM